MEPVIVARVKNAVHDPHIFPGTSKLYSNNLCSTLMVKGKEFSCIHILYVKEQKASQRGASRSSAISGCKPIPRHWISFILSCSFHTDTDMSNALSRFFGGACPSWNSYVSMLSLSTAFPQLPAVDCSAYGAWSDQLWYWGCYILVRCNVNSFAISCTVAL